MKIKRNAPDLLIAEDIPWFIAIMLWFFVMVFVAVGLFLLSEGVWAGLIFGLVGGGMGVAGIGLFVERLQLILDARAKTVTIRSRTIFRHKEIVLPLEDVIRATGEATLSGGVSDATRPRRRVHRPSLVLDDGSGEGEVLHPITEVYSSGQGAAELVRAVNGWLEVRRS